MLAFLFQNDSTKQKKNGRRLVIVTFIGVWQIHNKASFRLSCDRIDLCCCVDYLKKTVGDALSEGMARVVAQQPADAVDFLGRFLVHFAGVKEKELLVRPCM